MKHFNGRPIRNSASRFKGVFKNHDEECWRAQFYLAKGKMAGLGCFVTEEEAARAYDEAAVRYRGPEAFQNFRDMKAQTEPIIEGECARVPLSRGGHFIIDIADLDAVGQYYWHRHLRSIRGNRGMQSICLHSLLLGPVPERHAVVHLNGDYLDHRRSNLRVVPCTLHVGRHRKRATNCQSIYKGVKRRSVGSWQARICREYLGAFDNEVDAALAFDKAARERFGVCAALNFPLEGEVSCLVDSDARLAA